VSETGDHLLETIEDFKTVEGVRKRRPGGEARFLRKLHEK